MENFRCRTFKGASIRMLVQRCNSCLSSLRKQQPFVFVLWHELRFISSVFFYARDKTEEENCGGFCCVICAADATVRESLQAKLASYGSLLRA